VSSRGIGPTHRGDEIPAWLNLDALIEPGYVDRVQAATKELRDSIYTVAEIANPIRFLGSEFDEATAGTNSDEAIEALAIATGHREFRDLARFAVDLLENALDGKTTPDALLERYAREVDGITEGVQS
jgi:hypothetical protein